MALSSVATTNPPTHADEAVIGTVRGVTGQIVEIDCVSEQVPRVRELLYAPDIPDVIIETYAYTPGRTLIGLLLSPNERIVRNMRIATLGTELTVPVGREILGRVIDVFGNPLDGRGPLNAGPLALLYGTQGTADASGAAQVSFNTQFSGGTNALFETGIKVIDFFTPFLRGAKVGIVGGAGVGKTVLLQELLRAFISTEQGVALFAGIGERVREGHELWEYLEAERVLEKSALILGIMDQNAAVRLRTASAAATIAEYFRDVEKTNVLMFVDNIFRFLQAGSEVSTVLGEIPSELGYQATLDTEIARFEGRLASTHDASITAVQTVYVPADEFSDPAVAGSLAQLDTVIILSRAIAQRGRYPAIDMARSFSSAVSREIIGEEHYAAVTHTRALLDHYERLTRIVGIIGAAELSQNDRVRYQRAEKIINYMTQPLYTTEPHTGRPGMSVPRKAIVQDVLHILDGVYDSVPAERFLYMGDIPTTFNPA